MNGLETQTKVISNVVDATSLASQIRPDQAIIFYFTLSIFQDFIYIRTVYFRSYIRKVISTQLWTFHHKKAKKPPECSRYF